ncbi:MAG: hypothetical protein AB7T27_10145 [Kiritimatiellia bacterium]
MALHILISWDIKEKEPRWSELNSELKKCLSGYSWVKPLTTTYIVKIPSVEHRQAIRQKLVEVCQTNAKEINLLISPAMQGGSYGGWLPKDMWEKIRARTGGAQ